MSSGILLFTGAPESCTLDWDHPDLLDNFSEPFIRFAGLDCHDASSIHKLPATSLAPPSWRSIPLERQHLPTGHSQAHEYQGASFFTTSSVDSFIEELPRVAIGASETSSSKSADQVLSQFYEQSYAIHKNTASSQIAPASDIDTSLYSSSSSFDPSASSDALSQSFAGMQDVPIAGHISNLKDVPNASYLNSIQPQTMTVNLVVGIISVPSPRAIKTRRGADVELIEVLVGDETKSGFGVNFWLPASQSAQDNMRNVLSETRPQDIVLMRNVALSSFRGRVYGQSLRRDMTKVCLLYRNRIDRSDLGGCYNAADLTSTENSNHQVVKTARVREWVLKFVGAGHGHGKSTGRAAVVANETLPPDTQ